MQTISRFSHLAHFLIAIVAIVAVFFIGERFVDAQTTPPAPTVTSPANGSTVSVPVTVVWSNGAPSYYYTLWRGGTAVPGCIDLLYPTVQCTDSGASGSVTYYVSACSGPANGSPCSGSGPTNVTVGGGGGSTVPAAPSGLSLGGTPTASSLPLVWTDNSSNEDKFNIERKFTTDSYWTGTILSQLSGNTTTYTDSSVSPGTTYDYRVQACLSGTGCSEYTYLIGVSSAAGNSPPQAPTGLALSGTPTASSISLQWTDNSNNETHFTLQRKRTTDSNYSGSDLAQPSANTTTYTDTSVASGTTYDYRIASCLEGAGCSAYVYLIGVSSAAGDTTAPSGPSSLTATAHSSSQINLNWPAATDNVAVTGYKIYRNATLVTTLSSGSLSYSDTGLAAATYYAYMVKAIDAAGNESAGTNSGATTLAGGGSADTQSPSMPTGLVATRDDHNQVDLSWSASTDNVGVAGYSVKRRYNGIWSDLGYSTQTTYVDTTVSPSSSYYYAVVAYDAAGNRSATSSTLFLNTPAAPEGGTNTQVPASPTGLYYSLTQNGTRVDLGWTDNSSNETRFELYRQMSGGTWSYLSQTASNVATYSDTPSVGVYYYKVSACNSYGCSSGYSSVGPVTIAATYSSSTSGIPPAPTITSAQFIANGSYGSSTNLMWSDVSGEDSYKVYERLSGGFTWLLAKIRTSALAVVDAIYPSNTVSVQIAAYSSGTYEYKVSACNSSGCADSTPTSVTIGGSTGGGGAGGGTTISDTVPPGIPSGLVATKNEYNRVDLKWYASTDNVGVAGYSIRRSKSGVWSDLGNTAQTTWSDTTVFPGTSYYYAIIAYDAAGNRSATSSWLFLNTPLTASPDATIAAPTALMLAGTPTASSIPLKWTDNATTENLYIIERKRSTETYFPSTILAQLSANSTSYTDTTGAAGTSYDYRVKACLSGTGCSAYAYLTGVSTLYAAPTQNSSTTGEASSTVSQTTINTTNEDTTAPVMSLVRARNITAYGAQISWTTDDLSDSRVFFGVVPGSGTVYPRTSTARCDGGGNVSIHCVNLKDLSPGTKYYYRVYSRNTSGLETFSSEYGFISAADTSSSSTPVNTTSAPQSVSVSVATGDAFCDGAVGKTQVTFASSINGGAFFHITMTNGMSGDTSAGTFVFPNGSYRWEAIANAGYALSGAASGDLTLEKTCLTTQSSTAELSNETQTREAFKPYLTLNGPSIVIVPHGGVYEEYGAYGYTSLGGTAIPAKVAGALDTNRSGTYVVHYRLVDVSGNILAALERTVIVEEPVAVTGASASGDGTTSVSPPETVTSVDSVEEIGTVEQYKDYCDPVRAKECALYATQKIAATEPLRVLDERIGSRMFEDTDADGVTDYDEVNLYHTDPKKSDTNGDGISDGAHLLQGTNPLAPKPSEKPAPAKPQETALFETVVTTTEKQKIVFEDPRLSGEKKPELFGTGTVKVVSVPARNTQAQATATAKTLLTFGGTALPNSFVTVYVFSEPIVVTVKADDSGAWTYTLDKELPDGNHEFYSAITDAGGKIVAKSAPIPFVKVAAAVSVGSPELLAPTAVEPGFFAGGSFYAIIVILIGVLGIAFSVIGLSVRKNKGDDIAPPSIPAT